MEYDVDAAFEDRFARADVDDDECDRYDKYCPVCDQEWHVCACCEWCNMPEGECICVEDEDDADDWTVAFVIFERKA